MEKHFLSNESLRFESHPIANVKKRNAFRNKIIFLLGIKIKGLDFLPPGFAFDIILPFQHHIPLKSLLSYPLRMALSLCSSL